MAEELILTLSSLWNLLLRAFIVFLPALVGNAAPLVLRNLLQGKKLTPIDGGLSLKDGQRIFGENKSWEGFTAGVASGALVGLLYSMIFNNISWVIIGFLMGLGAMSGDLLNSFVKRRLKIRPSEPFIPWDQLSFLYIAFLFVYPVEIINTSVPKITLVDLATATYLVLILHPLTNLIAYWLRLKDKPW
jgi:CDP-2,3-bis-(O-geranylgeranyl)-sn-glycerol synthase